ncbi:hypothetical protein [Humisphaera borealis]|uniref:Uncharacterized protein n=1 Tax=Humisphaera borealis TaxID=2807512 RepID=A0A7M2X3D7_9BACT|nr:hypothetical protein [Humisphaera borealis]QOV92139.1 hypothetical protein IPV69_12600 [Humisphaera borealis]
MEVPPKIEPREPTPAPVLEYGKEQRTPIRWFRLCRAVFYTVFFVVLTLSMLAVFVWAAFVKGAMPIPAAVVSFLCLALPGSLAWAAARNAVRLWRGEDVGPI